MLAITIMMTILPINVDIKKNKNKTNLRNSKYKSNLNNDNNNNGDNGKKNNNKKSVFILGNSIVKNLNRFLITKAINQKCIVKVQPFGSAKVQCVYDHVKPITRHVNPDNIIFHPKPMI